MSSRVNPDFFRKSNSIPNIKKTQFSEKYHTTASNYFAPKKKKISKNYIQPTLRNKKYLNLKPKSSKTHKNRKKKNIK